MKKNIKRLHDSFYLKENRYEKTKESFKLLVKLLKKKIKKDKTYSLIDIGCANGELIYQLEKNFKNLRITGLDVRQDLLEKAKNNLSTKVKFIKKNIFTKQKLGKFDFIIASGVISITDNPKIFRDNLIKSLNKNGSIFLFNHFNKHDFNIFSKYQDLKIPKILQSGWNIFSLKFIKTLFNNRKTKYYQFTIKKKISPNIKDPIRSWTVKINGKNYFTNGLSLIIDQYWIQIDN
jgi:2-polyprenyl-3-methyl-5-hydroxy-6-metoxy-1,4-benzoquinol methylase|tara:strand:+ start:55 stop:756 length:702 start_codon:yes stop_codon:yes gene_type:complete